MISTPHESSKIDDFLCFLQSRLTRVEGMQLALHPELRETIFNKTGQLLIRLHKDTVLPGVITEEVFAKSIAPCIQAGLELLAHSGKSDDSQRLEQSIRGLLIGKQLPLVLCHGDFWMKNVLFDKASNEPTALIDWDRMQFHGPPVTDLLNLLLMSERRSEKNGFLRDS